jgi:hypothetical protein
MEVNTVVAAGHDVAKDHVRQATRETPILGSRERSIQIPPVGRVPRQLFKSQYVDYRDEHEGPGPKLKWALLNEVTDRTSAVDLVSMNGSRDEHRRAGLTPSPDMNR